MNKKTRTESRRRPHSAVEHIDKNTPAAPAMPARSQLATADLDRDPSNHEEDVVKDELIPDRIDMRLHAIERTFHDPRADFLVAAALDDETSPKGEKRLLRQAEDIFNNARAFAPRPLGTNVRASLIDALRRIGGAA